MHSSSSGERTECENFGLMEDMIGEAETAFGVLVSFYSKCPI